MIKYFLQIQRNDTVISVPISQTVFDALAEGEPSEDTYVEISAQEYDGDEVVAEVHIVGDYT